ncbi:glycogen-binding domain-containing protein [Hydrogenimonas sp.]
MIKISKKGKKAWVTFTLEGNGFDDAKIKGSWNDWAGESMKRKKNGDFYIVKVLPVGERFEFGYLADGRWIHDETLPETATPFGSHNSVLKT